MNCYARFKRDITDRNNNAVFKANIKNSNKTRYAIIDEDKEYLYIANEPNDIDCTSVTRIKKQYQRGMLDLVEE